MSTPTAYKYAIEKLHDVGDHLPIDRALDANLLPDDLLDRIAGDLGDGVDALKHVMAPATAVAVDLKHAMAPAAASAVDTGRQAAGSTRRLVQRHPVLVVSGVVLVIGAIAFIAARRRRDSHDRSNHADLASVA